MAGFLFKAKVLYQTVQLLRSIIEWPAGREPWTYWNHPFVIGFVVGTISIVQQACNGKLTNDQRHNVWVMVYRKFGQPPPFDVEGKRQDPAFEQGLQNAQTLFNYLAKVQPIPDGASFLTLRQTLFTDAIKNWVTG